MPKRKRRVLQGLPGRKRPTQNDGVLLFAATERQEQEGFLAVQTPPGVTLHFRKGKLKNSPYAVEQ
jgi:hypothetical protein